MIVAITIIATFWLTAQSQRTYRRQSPYPLLSHPFCFPVGSSEISCTLRRIMTQNPGIYSNQSVISAILNVRRELQDLKKTNAPRKVQIECFRRLINLYAALNLDYFNGIVKTIEQAS